MFNKLLKKSKQAPELALSSSNKIGIISYCDHLRTFAHVNHKYYASKHNYHYIFDISPTLNSPFKNKIEKILELLDLFEWVFWIDDDAFFLQYDKPLDQFIKGKEQYDLIFCKSPINEGNWTYLSSGNFFLKNTPKVKEFLTACLDTNLEQAKEAWDEEKFGLFTNGDQDVMVYLLQFDPRFNSELFHARYEYDKFNTREFHFKNKSNEHFLVHFTGTEKQQQTLDFAKKFSLSAALIPAHAFNAYQGKGNPATEKGFAD